MYVHTFSCSSHAQIISHEGGIVWAISPEDYYEHKDLFDHIHVDHTFDKLTRYDSGQGYDSTTNTYFDIRDKSIMTFTFSDGGDEDVDLVRALLMAGMIESKQYLKTMLTTV
jgi:hypothetical protein